MSVTLKDLAREVGCTTMAASYAMRGSDEVSPDLVNRVQEAAKRLGYRVNTAARGIRNGKSGLVAVVVDQMSQIRDGDVTELNKAGFDVVVVLAGAESIKRIESRGVEGVVWSSGKRRGNMAVPVGRDVAGLLKELR